MSTFHWLFSSAAKFPDNSRFPDQLVTVLYLIKKKRVLFRDLIFKIEILLKLYILRSPESENWILNSWFVCVCYQHTLKRGQNGKSKFAVLYNYYNATWIFLESIRAWISGQDGEIRGQNLEIPSKIIVRAGDSRPRIHGFLEMFSFYETKLLVPEKFADFLVTFENFLVHGNFLLLIGGDSFPILPGIRCSSIRKFGT